MNEGTQGRPLEPFFFSAPRGERFCIFHPATGTAREAVLYVHPFAEEMNKARRMAALQSRMLAIRRAVTRNPVDRCAHAYAKFPRNGSQASPRANRLSQLTAAVFKRTFLGMAYAPINTRERYTKSEGVGTAPFFRQTTCRRRCAGGNSGRSTGSLRFPALCSSIVRRGIQLTLRLRRSINAETPSLTLILWSVGKFLSELFPLLFHLVANAGVWADRPEHWDARLTETWDAAGRSWPARNELIALLTTQSDVILHVSCSDSSILRNLKGRGYLHPRGLEISEYAIGHPRGKGKTMRFGLLSSIALPDASSDAVIASEILKHVNRRHSFPSKSPSVETLSAAARL